jgi:hypothetical protein
MSVILNSNNFEINKLFFIEEVKNNVKSNSFFSRIIYSTDYFALKNIYLTISIQNVTFKDQYLKTIVYFNEKDNDFTELYAIEDKILKKFIDYKTINKTYKKINPIYSIKSQCEQNFIKIFKNNYNESIINISIKISGIWQTDNNIGITFKFI